MTTTIDGKPLEADLSQDRAIDMMLHERFGLVTGGPGTGKTTCVKRVLTELGPRARVGLCAPTGKAAKRLQETTGRKAQTIHRLLQYRPGAGFTYNRDAPLEYDLVICDESSMVDIELAGALWDAIGDSGRIIMIGDADQLPPVGPGRPFADLCTADEVPKVRLTTLHRQEEQSWVALNAPRVLVGEAPDLTARHDFEFVPVVGAAEVVPAVVAAVGGDKQAQVLIPQRPGAAGVTAANVALQGALNQEPDFGDKGLQREHYRLRVGDQVIHTRNDYTLGVFNGEIGEMVDYQSGHPVVLYPDGGLNNEPRQVTYATFEQAGALELSYALTVHRSQGSEFPRVVCVVHSTHSYALSRQLVYTAITRTRGRLVIVGDRLGIERALSSTKVQERNTTLLERLRGQLDDVTDDSAWASE
jgi:exodeoxyribonuclease V alpha subunit